MGNIVPVISDQVNSVLPLFAGNEFEHTSNHPEFDTEEHIFHTNCDNIKHELPPKCVCMFLKEEVQALRKQIKDMNTRHNDSMDSADQWVQLEREYKDREETYRAKECCLKQKIQKLQDCLRDDARAANEKILQLEDAEENLKACLLRISKERGVLEDEHKTMMAELERTKEQCGILTEQQAPTLELLDQEKKLNKALSDELTFIRRLQQENDTRNLAEIAALQGQLINIKKELVNMEVSNSELRQVVATLEQKIVEMQSSEKENEEKVRLLNDEIRCKEALMCKLERRLEHSTGFSFAQEQCPPKRVKREEVKDLKSASSALANALRNIKQCERSIPPSHQQFTNVALEVKRLADTLLHGKEEDDTDFLAPTSTDASDPEPVPKPEAEQDTNSLNEPDEANEVTVGVALVPEFVIGDQLQSFSLPEHFSKTDICEVPSEMRKLSLSAQEDLEKQKAMNPKKMTPLIKKRKILVLKRTKDTFKARIRRYVSTLNSRKPLYFMDPAETSRSEILQRTMSIDSFHSLEDDDMSDLQDKVDAFTETLDMKVDKGTETMVRKKERSVQVDDDMNPEKILDRIPSVVRGFVNMLKASVSNSIINHSEFNRNLSQRWHDDRDFRHGLELLRSYSVFEGHKCRRVTGDNYEQFAHAMSSLRSIKDMFKPTKVPIIQQIEDQITEQIMSFHTKCMESEFYCTVYYPVKRKSN